ncbi:MAG: putative maltokinase [Candidatus Acidiferrales bacterium]
MSLRDDIRASLPSQLPQFLTNQRWFRGKAREIRSTKVVDVVALENNQFEAFVLLVRVEYASGSDETYILPMTSVAHMTSPPPNDISFLVARNSEHNKEVILTDASQNETFLLWLLDAIEAQNIQPGISGQIRAEHTNIFQKLRSGSRDGPHPVLMKGEQSNTSINYGDRFILKLFRHLEEGINPDLEIGLFLTEKSHFRNVARVAGSLFYHAGDREPTTLGILQEFIPNQGDAWRFTMGALSGFWEQVSAYSKGPPAGSATEGSGLPYDHDTPSLAIAWIGPYLDAIGLLGRRTSELHLALASDLSHSAFAPEAYTPSLHGEFENSAREMTERNLALLRTKLHELPDEMRDYASGLLGRKDQILEQLQSTLDIRNGGMRIRIHGDYHLGQVLYTGSDFVVIDFEGEPMRSLSERRIKRSPLQDVASMLRSFHYAAFAQLLAPLAESAPPKDFRALAPWANIWYKWVTARFLNTYLKNANSTAFLPPGRKEISAILKLYLLEKAIYELGYELNNRPAWVAIPLAGISGLLDQSV